MDAQVVIDRIEVALAAGETSRWTRALFDDADWRPHLVGGLALLLMDDPSADVDNLWEAITRGSWVLPQLVVVAYLVDATFPARVRNLVENGCKVSPPSGLSPAERHSATGPGSAVQRSAKLAASLACVGRRVPSLSPWLDEVCTTPPFDALLAQDVDDAPGIAVRWLNALERQFALRGRTLRPGSR
jgi:hypothetical protein